MNHELKNSKSTHLKNTQIKFRDRNLDYSFTYLKVDVGREDELVQHYDSLTYLKEQGS